MFVCVCTSINLILKTTLRNSLMTSPYLFIFNWGIVFYHNLPKLLLLAIQVIYIFISYIQCFNGLIIPKY